MTRRTLVVLVFTIAVFSFGSGSGSSRAATRSANAGPPGDEVERAYAEVTRLIDEYRGDTSQLMRAAQLVERILHANPKHAGAHVQAARIVFDLGHRSHDEYDPGYLDRAQQLIDRALELDPKLPDAYRMASWAAWARKDLPAARRLAARAEALDPKSVYLAFLLAELDLTERRLDAAATRYRALIGAATDRRTQARAYEGLATTLWFKKDYEAAEGAYEEVIRLDPDSAWAKGNYAERLVHLKKWDRAIEMGTAALVQMDYPAGRATLARAHLGKGYELMTQGPGRFEEALPHLRRAVALDPSNGQAHYWLGANYVRLYLQANDQRKNPERRLEYLNGAEHAFRKVLELEPANDYVRRDLERTLSEKARLQAQ